MVTINKPVIVALDYAHPGDALAMARQLDPSVCQVKVGKELFTSGGPQLLDELHQLGFDIFLDLKFHDIPNTCAKAVLAAAKHGVWMVNVHASGGPKMMQTTKDELAQYQGKHPIVIGVTVLTSMDQNELAITGIQQSISERVLGLAALTKSSGLSGVVCSAQEATLIKQSIGQDFITVTPGIRPHFASKNDQKRIMTPAKAVQSGSDYLVIGRPITQASNPLFALQSIMDELNSK